MVLISVQQQGHVHAHKSDSAGVCCALGWVVSKRPFAFCYRTCLFDRHDVLHSVLCTLQSQRELVTRSCKGNVVWYKAPQTSWRWHPVDLVPAKHPPDRLPMLQGCCPEASTAAEATAGATPKTLAFSSSCTLSTAPV